MCQLKDLEEFDQKYLIVDRSRQVLFLGSVFLGFKTSRVIQIDYIQRIFTYSSLKIDKVAIPASTFVPAIEISKIKRPHYELLLELKCHAFILLYESIDEFATRQLESLVSRNLTPENPA